MTQESGNAIIAAPGMSATSLTTTDVCGFPGTGQSISLVSDGVRFHIFAMSCGAIRCPRRRRAETSHACAIHWPEAPGLATMVTRARIIAQGAARITRPALGHCWAGRVRLQRDLGRGSRTFTARTLGQRGFAIRDTRHRLLCSFRVAFCLLAA